jgi:PAS domain S-box-containing protein
MLAQLIPHLNCYLCQSNLVKLHLIYDFLIAGSYYLILITLIYLIRQHQLLYPSVFWLFEAFIVCSGTNYLMDWMLWHPNYLMIADALKALTALISLCTAIQSIYLISQALQLPNSEQLKTEIAERKQTERALQESESNLSSFYNFAPMMMGIVELIGTEDFRYISDNQTSATFFGLTPETMSGKLGSQLWHSEELQHRFVAACLQSQSTLQPVNFEFTHYLQQDARHFSLTISTIAPQFDASNARFSYIIEDISDRKRMENRLQEGEELLRLAFEDAAIGKALVSLDGNFLKVNRSLCEIVGYEDAELLSLTFQEITHPEDLDRDLNLVRQVLAGKIDKYQMEKRYFHKSGTAVWILLNVSLVRDLQQQPQYFIAQVQDISDRKAAEIKIKKSLAEKEVMLKEIHHRVKNNLQVICSLLNLQSRYIREEKIIKSFKETQNRVKSMALVHEQLYQSSNLSQICLSEYVRQLSNNLLRAYSITSELELETEIEDFCLDLDTAVPCGLIINEVISNAIKYAFNLRSKGKILFQGFANQQRELVIIIADNGVGLPPNFQLENSNSLGLKLVKNLTQQLQGNFKINSDRNSGTKFEFTFTRIKK